MYDTLTGRPSLPILHSFEHICFLSQIHTSAKETECIPLLVLAAPLHVALLVVVNDGGKKEVILLLVVQHTQWWQEEVVLIST